MNNFKAIVSKANAAKYPWPDGWERNEKVAKELGVSPDRVSEVLKPALDQGFIERQIITVWNQEKHRVDRVTGWREVVKTAGRKA
jgi:hypothetical protein